LVGFSQADSTYTFSLVEAQKYAEINNPVIKNSELDLEKAKKKIWETTAIGLPQVNAKISASYQITVSPVIEQLSQFNTLGPTLETMGKGMEELGNGMGAMSKTMGTYAEIMALLAQERNMEAIAKLQELQAQQTSAQKTASGINQEPTKQNTKVGDSLRWSTTIDVTVTQLIFSGAYLVGLQTSRTFKSLSEIAITKSNNEVYEQVSNAYALILVLEQNKAMMDSIFNAMQTIVKELEALNNQGLIDQIRVDQIRLTSNTIKSAIEALNNQIRVSYNLLKFQIGIPITSNLVLTDNISLFTAEDSMLKIATTEFNKDANTDLKLLETSIKLNELNVKYQKSAFLPDVAAFYQHQEELNNKALSFTPPDLIGVSVNIPIFGSGMKIARVQQAKIELHKANNDYYQATQGLILAHSEAKSNYLNAYNTLDIKKQSVELSKKIYNQTLIRYKNGMASGSELTQMQTQYFQAQSDYTMSLIQLINAKNKLEKLNK
ncbi:MAG: TolC family protein, partial [Bacteroidales bacterium]